MRTLQSIWLVTWFEIKSTRSTGRSIPPRQRSANFNDKWRCSWHDFQCLTAPKILRVTVRNVVARLLARTSFTKVISSSGPGQNLVRCTTVLVWTPLTNTITPENGCAVLEAGAGGHIPGFTAANGDRMK